MPVINMLDSAAASYDPIQYTPFKLLNALIPAQEASHHVVSRIDGCCLYIFGSCALILVFLLGDGCDPHLGFNCAPCENRNHLLPCTDCDFVPCKFSLSPATRSEQVKAANVLRI